MSELNIPDEKITFLESKGYIYDKFLGNGSFGMVCKFINPEGKSVAVKIIRRKNLTDEDKKIISNEIIIHENLNHQNIVKLEQYSINESYCYMVLELCSYSLYKIIHESSNQMTEDYCFKILFELADAINYIHERLIIHNDIKAENILVDFNGIPKITDFGFSVQLNNIEDKCNDFKGTLDCNSPEKIQGSYGLQSDIWALGVLFFEMLFKKVPFDGCGRRDTERKILRGKYNISSRDISDKSKILLSRMIDINPEMRITSGELSENHF